MHHNIEYVVKLRLELQLLRIEEIQDNMPHQGCRSLRCLRCFNRWIRNNRIKWIRSRLAQLAA